MIQRHDLRYYELENFDIYIYIQLCFYIYYSSSCVFLCSARLACGHKNIVKSFVAHVGANRHCRNEGKRLRAFVFFDFFLSLLYSMHLALIILNITGARYTYSCWFGANRARSSIWAEQGSAANHNWWVIKNPYSA